MTESVPYPSQAQSTFLQSLIVTFSSPYTVPLVSGWLMAVHPVDMFLVSGWLMAVHPVGVFLVSGWLMAVHPVDVFSHLETVRMHCQKSLIFVTWEKSGHLASRIEFFGKPGQSHSIPTKPELSPENLDDCLLQSFTVLRGRGLDSNGSGYKQVSVSCEHGHES
jgi:hypothetical protein